MSIIYCLRSEPDVVYVFWAWESCISWKDTCKIWVADDAVAMMHFPKTL